MEKGVPPERLSQGLAMLDSPSPVAGPYFRNQDAAERERFRACDRVTLYARGLGLGAVPSLQLAMESMRRAGEGASLEAVMREMHELLDEHGIGLRLLDRRGDALHSGPPMNRRSMVSEGVSRASVFSWARKSAHRILIAPILRTLTWMR